MTAAAWPQEYLTRSGTQFHSCDNTTSWTLSASGASAGSVYAVDTDNKKEGTGCVSITTPTGSGTSTYAQIRTNNLSVSCNGRLGFWFYVADYSKLNKISIYFSQDTSFTNFFLTEISFNLASTNDQMKFNGWRWIEVAPTGSGHEFTWGAGGGSPSFPNAYTNVQIRFYAQTGEIASCKIDNFTVDSRQRTKLLITADDSNKTWHDLGIPELDSRDLVHTYSQIYTAIGGGSQITVANLDTVYANGHDICPHGDTNLSTLTTAQALADIFANIEYLRANGWDRALNFYVWPNGVWEASAGSNALIDAAQSLGIVAARGVSRQFAAKAPFGLGDRAMMIPIIGWTSTDTVSDVLGEIDSAVKNGAGVISLMFHNVVASGATDTDILTSDLQSLLNGIVKRKYAGLIDVVTASQFLTGLTHPALVS